MAKRNTQLDDLARGFLATRPAAFDKFLNDNKESAQSIPLIQPDLNQEDLSAVASTNLPTDLTDKPKEVKTIIHKTRTIDESREKPTSLNKTNTSSKQNSLTTLPIASSDLLMYESLFLGKSESYKGDQDDSRVYVKGYNAKILSRLVLYAEHHKKRASVQLILDNILRHHFEHFASEIKQIDQILLGILQQQINK